MRGAAGARRVVGGDALRLGEELRRALDAVVRAVVLAVVLVGGAVQVLHIEQFGAPAVDPGETPTHLPLQSVAHRVVRRRRRAAAPGQQSECGQDGQESGRGGVWRGTWKSRLHVAGDYTRSH